MKHRIMNLNRSVLFRLACWIIIGSLMPGLLNASPQTTGKAASAPRARAQTFNTPNQAAEALIAAAEKYDGDQPVNLGSGYEISIRDLSEMIVRLTGFEGRLVWQTDKPNGQPRRGLDVTRAREYFGWSAQVPFEEGMRRTIEWYKANREKIR